MCLDAVIVDFDRIVTAPGAALEQFARALEHTAVLIMGRPGLQPDGAPSPMRCFLEHPPAKDELKVALEQCAAVPLRAAR
jgi:hypothetical protein